MLAWRANAIMEELFHCMTIEINVVEAFTHVSLDVTIPFTLIRYRQNSFQNFKNPFSLIFYVSPVKLKIQYISLLQSISLMVIARNTQKHLVCYSGISHSG